MKTPGDLIRERCEALGWTQADLAYVLGVTTATINQLINGKRGVTSKMAKGLGAALMVEPVTIVRLQAERELEGADEPRPAIAARARILSVYPLREMLKRGWVEETDDPRELEQRVCRFFGTESVGDIPHLSHAAKRSPSDKRASQLAWLFRVRQIANEMPTPAFSRKNLADAIEQMSQFLGNREEVRHVPKLLHNSGVRYVVVEGLSDSKIDGACLWLDAKSPVIGMSLRFDRIDNFWFVLRHECAHVLHGHGQDIAIIDSELQQINDDESEEERIANTEAAEFCVPQAKMDSFYIRKNPLFSEKDVLAFSKRLKVHPGIIVGQLHKRRNRYDFLRHNLVSVRDQIEGDAMIDGYGHFVPIG
ncbi:MAG: helix-turn-helix domain-containing protein [Gammaproteobacteria bacterium]|nr:helix-turn-helix domain-containing protein [Gammaproteobacteria bacterium]